MAEIKVAILMGSDSDVKIMKKAKEVLDKFGVACEMRITSAHRTPRRTRTLVYDLEKRGCKIYICGAGMAAHLAGAVASYTTSQLLACH